MGMLKEIIKNSSCSFFVRKGIGKNIEDTAALFLILKQ